LKLFDEGHIRAAATYNDLGFNSFFRRGWKRFYLKWYDAPVPSTVALCPKTVELVQSIPTLNGAMFAMLPADGDLGRHRDPFAGSLRYHLGLATPNSDLCCIYVDGQPYAWRDGEDVMFDETYIHWAENRTGVDRVILFCAAIAIIGQESGFQADPAVPGLAKIARAELDKRRESAGIPKFALDAALALPSTSGKSYGDRLDAVKTEQQRTSSAASRSERRCSPIATRSGPGGLCR
ncbi:MAG: DUF1615 family protein, partial [Burkholderiales bacterium]|nr:DUF1615 family protein [Burkholderiales bacterium]